MDALGLGEGADLLRTDLFTPDEVLPGTHVTNLRELGRFEILHDTDIAERLPRDTLAAHDPRRPDQILGPRAE